jgi:hypothetical protein
MITLTEEQQRRIERALRTRPVAGCRLAIEAVAAAVAVFTAGAKAGGLIVHLT